MIINPNKLSSFSVCLLLLSESMSLMAKVLPVLKFSVLFIDIIISLVGIYLFFLIMVSLIVNKKVLIFFILFTILLSIFVILFSNLSLAGSTADGVRRYTFSIYLPVFLKYLIYLGVFSFFDPNAFAFRFMKALLLLCILLPIFMISDSLITINYNLFQDYSRAWTLTYSDTLCLFTFLLYPNFHRFKHLIVLLLLFSVFLIGSRTNLVIALFVILINLFVLNKSLTKISLFGFTVILALFLLLDNIEVISDSLGANNSTFSRLFNLFMSNEDLSFLERKHFEKKGLIDIIENPIIGKFGGQLKVSGLTDELSPRWGGYIHNYLSFIRQFGLIGLNLLFIYLYASYKVVKKTNLKIFVIYLLLMYLLSRSFVYPYLFIVIGLWLKLHFRSQLLYRV